MEESVEGEIDEDGDTGSYSEEKGKQKGMKM